MFYQFVQSAPITAGAEPALGTLGEMTGQTGVGSSLVFIAFYLLVGCTALAALMAVIGWVTAWADEEQSARGRMVFFIALGALLIEFFIWRAMTAVIVPDANQPIYLDNLNSATAP